jgi:hypothetical protein
MSDERFFVFAITLGVFVFFVVPALVHWWMSKTRTFFDRWRK